MPDFTRIKRMEGQIKQEVAVVLQDKLRDRRVGMVTVTAVKLSRDLSYCDLYVTFLGGDSLAGGGSSADGRAALGNAARVKILQNASGFIRAELTKRVQLRVIPSLRFHFDKLSESGPRIEQLIAQASKKRDQQSDSTDEG